MPNGPISCFIDTNVLLYLRDERTPQKRQAAERWIDALARRRALVISPQVINEFCNVTRSKFPHVPLSELRRAIEAMESWCSAETSFATAARALDLQSQMHVRFYDAVLLSSALLADCTHFLSEDLQHDRLIGHMRVLNPFLVSPEAVLAA